MKSRKDIRKLTLCAVIAALYAVITIITAPLSYGLVNFRLSEALVPLCAMEPVLGIGITLGCFLANLFSTVTALDMVVGTAATALACLWTARCRKTWFLPVPNILLNALLVGGMLAFVLYPGNLAVGFAVSAAQVAFGEAVVLYGLGMPLYVYLKKIDLFSVLLEGKQANSSQNP